MSGDKWFVKHEKAVSDLVTLNGRILVKIADLQMKIHQAQQPPLTGNIYKIEKWNDQITILKQLLEK